MYNICLIYAFCFVISIAITYILTYCSRRFRKSLNTRLPNISRGPGSAEHPSTIFLHAGEATSSACAVQFGNQPNRTLDDDQDDNDSDFGGLEDGFMDVSNYYCDCLIILVSSSYLLLFS